ncbi:MAG: PASTA domain-containing protein [bacterium]
MRIFNIFFSLTILCIMIAGLFYVYNFFYGHEEGLVVVPNIVNMDIYAAQENLKLINLKLEIVSYSFSNKPKNVIIRQYPEPGVEVRKNSIVKVVISVGKREQELPNFTGKKIDEFLSDPIVNSFLKKYNLSIRTIYYPSLLIHEGQIVMQVPFNDFPKNKKVNLIVAKKPTKNDLQNYVDLSDFLYSVDNDAYLIELEDTFENEDRVMQDIDISPRSIVAKFAVNYRQLPTMKITSIYLKTPYTSDINHLEIVLSDFLGSRVVLKQYYTGMFVSNLQIYYIGEGKIIVKINGKSISSYSLP